MARVYLSSLGCAKNLVDSEVMLGSLLKEGYGLSLTPKEADIIIVNTCSFIGPAKKESIDTVLEMAEYKVHGACQLLVVAGCLAQRYHNELLKKMPEVDMFVGTGEFQKIIPLVESKVRERRLSKPEFTYTELTPRINTQPKHRAYIKVAEGCSTGCAFCIIPRLRGGAKSRPISDVVKEAENFIDQGVKELLIVAQNLTEYGYDRDKTFWLATLVRELDKLDCRWIRLHYCYPDHFSEELIRVIADSDKICHYLDIPFQHINDQILFQMNRRGTSKKQILSLLARLRREIPDISIRSTFITGFPGETEEQFQELITFLQEARLDHVGVFPYSNEENTLAERLGWHIPEETRVERAEELMKIQQEISRENLQRYIGKQLSVLAEEVEEKNGSKIYIGRSQYQAPEVDGSIIIDEGDAKVGDFVEVRIEHALDYDLIGKVRRSREATATYPERSEGSPRYFRDCD